MKLHVYVINIKHTRQRNIFCRDRIIPPVFKVLIKLAIPKGPSFVSFVRYVKGPSELGLGNMVTHFDRPSDRKITWKSETIILTDRKLSSIKRNKIIQLEECSPNLFNFSLITINHYFL